MIRKRKRQILSKGLAFFFLLTLLFRRLRYAPENRIAIIQMPGAA
ncbi:hypothetical protein ACTNEF_10885 [Bariatricus sp. HCP28S3_E4]